MGLFWVASKYTLSGTVSGGALWGVVRTLWYFLAFVVEDLGPGG